jgi:hypothetical protein
MQYSSKSAIAAMAGATDIQNQNLGLDLRSGKL